MYVIHECFQQSSHLCTPCQHYEACIAVIYHIQYMLQTHATDLLCLWLHSRVSIFLHFSGLHMAHPHEK
jgi:hypothetical protein